MGTQQQQKKHKQQQQQQKQEERQQGLDLYDSIFTATEREVPFNIQ